MPKPDSCVRLRHPPSVAPRHLPPPGEGNGRALMDLTYGLIGFAIAHILAVASPGPSFVLVAQTAASRSRASALVATAALTVGAALWAAAALFGLQSLFKHA